MGPKANLDTSEKKRLSCPCLLLNQDFSDVQPVAKSLSWLQLNHILKLHV